MVAGGVFLFALALRLLHIWQIRLAPFFDLKLGDAAAYDEWARRIAAGEWIGRGVFYQAPLYPYALALLYTIGAQSVAAVRVFQAVLSAASCALLADTGWRLFSRRAGIAAGVLLACYPPAIFLDTLIQKSVFDLGLLCLLLWVISRILEREASPDRSSWLSLGAALGALSLTRENALVLGVPIAIWIAARRVDLRARTRAALWFAAGLTLVLAPVAARNTIVGGELFVTTSQFGPNLYIGNNEQADGTYRSLRPFRQRPAFEQQDAIEIAERAAGRPLRAAEVSAYYTDRVLAFVRAQPGRWLSLLWRKFLLTWNTTEISDTEDQYTYAEWSWPLAFGDVWHLGVLAPLAAIGVWISAARWRRLFVVYLMLAAYVASVVLFYVFARYRYPIVPFLILFAAEAVTGLHAFVRSTRPAALAGCAAVVVAAAVVSNLPLVPRYKLEAATHYNVGVGLEARGRIDEAIGEYEAAVARDRDLAPAHNDLGLLLARMGRAADAARELADAARLSPADPKLRNNLGVVLARLGEMEAALPQLAEAVRLDPTYDEARRNLTGATAAAAQQAGALAQNGRLDEAARLIRAAIAAAPDRADLHNDLGIVLAQHGDVANAAAEFERAAALNPGDAAARRNLERLKAQR